MKIVSSAAMARIDSRSQTEFSIPSMVLMEDAGVKAWAATRRLVWKDRTPRLRLVFVAGKGNNGGDAMVMARQAAVEGHTSLTLVLAGARPDPDSVPGRMLAMCESLGIECVDWPVQAEHVLVRLAEAGWIFDGIAGTGLQGALRPPLDDLVRHVNESPGKKIAIDVPSGVGDGFRASFPAVHAVCTLTMGLPKQCLYLPAARLSCGKIIVIPVGFPPALVEDPSISGELLSPRAWRSVAPPIPADTHKNQRGHCAVFAGSPGTTGAGWLCATAAARSRVGLVTLFIESAAYPAVAPRCASIMCRPWDAPPEGETSAWDPSRYSGVLVGPGWGLAEEKARWLDRLIASGAQGVIDADAITLLGRRQGRVDCAARWVLTPHPGELTRLMAAERDSVLEDPVGHALAASRRFNAVVALKGHSTVIASPDGRYWIFDGANPALATGGSGDVLAGIIAGGVAGGMSPVDAALFGVSLHAHVGRSAARRRGWFLAEDLLPLISRALWT